CPNLEGNKDLPNVEETREHSMASPNGPGSSQRGHTDEKLSEPGDDKHNRDHSGADHAGRDHSGHDHSGHDHSGHDHSEHVAEYRRLFWVMLVFAIPTTALSPAFANLLGYDLPDQPWILWFPPVVGTVMFFWGGKPFLAGA